MTGRTLDPRKYPDDYLVMLDAAQSAPLRIPGDAGLRGYIQSFLRACEASGGALAEKARNLQATCKDGVVVVQHRNHGVYALAVRQALPTSLADEAAGAAGDFLKRLGASDGPL